MTLLASEIAQVLHEIALPLQDGWIQKIYQPEPFAITLEIRTTAETACLYISTDPQIPRIHLLTRRSINPSTPPQFCQCLRRRLRGARLTSIAQPFEDRIVRLQYRKRHDQGSLIAELTGRGANLYLLDGNDTVVTSLRPSRLTIGDHYEPPLRPSSPIPHARVASICETDQQATDAPYPVNRNLETCYARHVQERAAQHERQARLTVNARRMKKTKRHLAALKADLARVDRYKPYQRYGELLKTSLHTIPKGATHVTIQDYFNPALGMITIHLDPSRSANENMNEHFRKYRKYCSAQRELLPRIEEVQHTLNALTHEREHLLHNTPPLGAGIGSFTSLTPPFPIPEQHHQGKRQAKAKRPYRRFLSRDGLTIAVGRNASENEALTFRTARGRDLWMHARGVPGSHVAVFVNDQATVPQQTLHDAAQLALLYSDRKRSGHGDVSYTLRKYVKKTKGGPPGAVTITQEKNMYVELDDQRLHRLKQSEW